jgi:hypothetical protein
MDQDFAKRVATINALGLKELDIWKSPIPAGWLQGVADFVRTPQCNAAIQGALARRRRRSAAAKILKRAH